MQDRDTIETLVSFSSNSHVSGPVCGWRPSQVEPYRRSSTNHLDFRAFTAAPITAVNFKRLRRRSTFGDMRFAPCPPAWLRLGSMKNHAQDRASVALAVVLVVAVVTCVPGCGRDLLEPLFTGSGGWTAAGASAGGGVGGAAGGRGGGAGDAGGSGGISPFACSGATPWPGNLSLFRQSTLDSLPLVSEVQGDLSILGAMENLGRLRCLRNVTGKVSVRATQNLLSL